MDNLGVASGATIVVFVRNEEEVLAKVLDQILLNYNPGKIVVVISKDTVDRSAEIAKQRNIKVITDSGKGKGDAVRMAIDNIPDNILVFIDADGSHKAEDIPMLIEPIERGEADLVVASRLSAGSDEFSGNIGNIMHYIGNVMSSFIINLIWGRGKRLISDSQNGFRAIRREVARQLDLKETSFAIEEEMVIKCIKKGYRIHEIRSHELKRQYGKSHINPIKMLPKYVWCFIRNL